MWNLKFSLYIPNFMQMGEKAVINDELHLKWWPPPSWIYYFSRFWSRDLLPVATNHISTENFMNFFSVGSWFVMLCVKIQNGGRRHVKFHICSILWHNYM